MLSDWRHMIAHARDEGHRPRVHGNGFIQLDVNDHQRFHFWGHPGIPRQARPSPIHNHVFDFHSHVLKGCVTNVVYDPVWRDDGLYSEWQAVPDPRPGHHSSTLQRTGRRCDLFVFKPGLNVCRTSYAAVGADFHETLVHEPSVTCITKTGPTLQQRPNGPKPSVLMYGFDEPDNTFDRHGFADAMLWDLIWEVAS
jgi:hypothetical protein